jgi:hypothetical protein
MALACVYEAEKRKIKKGGKEGSKEENTCHK